MLGYSVESGDFNLPVDAVTEKPLCAYSLNRKIRETYDGQFFDYTDKSGSGSYPNRTPDPNPYQVPHQVDYTLVELGTRLDIGRENMDPKLGDAELFGGSSGGNSITVVTMVESTSTPDFYSGGGGTMHFEQNTFTATTGSNTSIALWSIFLTPLTYTIEDIDQSVWYVKTVNGSRLSSSDGLASVVWFVFTEDNGDRFFVPAASNSNPSWTEYNSSTYNWGEVGYTIAANSGLKIIDIPEDFTMEPGREFQIATGGGANSRSSGWSGSYGNYFQIYQTVNETTSYPRITKIYDQKTRHEMPVRDVDVDMGIGENAEGKFYMTFDSLSTFNLPIADDVDSRVGVLAVADPDPYPSARSPLVTFQGETEQLALDLNPGYMRFYLYTEEEKHDIKGGLDSPNENIRGVVCNYDGEFIIIETENDYIGKAITDRAIPEINTVSIGKDATAFYQGKLYELMICDFPIHEVARSDIFPDVKNYYSLT